MNHDVEWTRKRFLGMMLAAAACPSAAWAADDASSELCIGVLSDIHVHLSPGEDPSQNDSVLRFRKALEYFRERKVDGVLICGDLADKGLDIELKAVADTWFSVFPDGKLPNGSPVANLMHYGDHDAEVRFWKSIGEKVLAECARRGVPPVRSLAVGENRKTCWEEYFHEPWSPIQVKKVKGRTFVLAHFIRETAGWNKGLEEALAAAGLASDELFFFSQHRPFRSTWHARWGADSGRNEKVFAAYPNAVAFFGHTHYTLTDDRTVWQGAFTAVNAGALKNQSVDRHHENGTLIPWVKSDAERDLDMPCVPSDICHGGMVMHVVGDRITLERHDFGSGLPLGPDLVFSVDVPARRRGEEIAAAKKVLESAPVFPVNAAVSVTRGPAKSRRKRVFDALKLQFPVAKATDRSPRAYDYRVCAYAADGRLVKERFVFSPAANRPEPRDEGPAVCLFDAHDVADATRFTVEARSCWGNHSVPLVVSL